MLRSLGGMYIHHIMLPGAGVIGLTTAILLKRHGYQDITIVGKHHPGDKPTHEYTSPWAGASIVSFAAENKLLQGRSASHKVKKLFSILDSNHILEVDQISFQEFKRQAESVPESGVMYCPGIHLSEVDDPAHEAWSKKLYQDVCTWRNYSDCIHVHIFPTLDGRLIYFRVT